MSPLLKSLASATAGALIYGSWAYYVNSDAGAEMAARTAAVQGSFSFVLTLSMTLMLEYLYRLLGPGQGAAVITTALVSAFMFATAYTLQWVAGSKEILMTILPGYVIGTVYAGTYAWSLQRGSSQAQALSEDAAS